MILSKNLSAPIDLDRLVNDFIKTGKTERLLLLVPTNRKLRNLKKEIISLSPRETASDINLETLTTISSRLLGELNRFHELSEAASTILIKQSALEIKTKYFKAYRDEIPFGTLDRIKNVISEYKKHGITPEILIAEAEKLDSAEKLKALDIAAIYESYNAKCRNLNALEIGDIYNLLDEIEDSRIENLFRKIYPEVELTALLGFDELTKPEAELINKISEIENLDLYINFDYFGYNKYIFSHLEKTYESLENKGFKKINDISPNTHNEFQNSVREKLFRINEEKISKFSDNLFRLAAGNREEEIILIAKEIKKLLQSPEVQPHQICVAFNLIDKYSPIIRDVFRSYGIPFNLTDRISLNNSFPVIELMNFLEILENDFYHKNIFRALSGGFIKIKDVDLYNLKKIAAQLKIVAGREHWINSVRKASANLKYEEDISQAAIMFRKRQFEKAETDINEIYEALKVFDKKLTMKDFVRELKNLALKLNLHKNLLLNADGSEEENIKAVSSFFETIEEIFELLQLEEEKEKKYDLDFFLDQIRTASAWARFNVKEKSNFGVQVTTINEIRGLKFDMLFLSGMNDGDFPTRYVPEIFFSGSFARSENRHLTEQRYHFYQALCAWKKRLYLTFPKMDKDKEIVESTFLKDFANRFELTEIKKENYSGLIFSKEEFLEYAGKSGIDFIEKRFSADALEDIPSTEKMKKSINIEKLRKEEGFPESVYNGFLFAEDAGEIPPKTKEHLEKMQFNQYSISQLENYAKCPFKYFMERILKVELTEEPTEEVEALELGSVLHSILFNFYTELRSKNIDLSDSTSYNFNEVKDLLFKIGREISEKVFYNSEITFFERERLFGIGGKEEESILYKFLENEIANSDTFKPKFFEVSFGRTHKEETDAEISRDEPLKVADVKLAGKIDRIEVDEKEKKFNIVDYKLGYTKPTRSDFAEGISLQLPVYMRITQLLLNEKYGCNYQPGEMYIYSLKFDEDKFGKTKIAVKDQASLINEIIEKVKLYVENISEGKFNLSLLERREEKVCRFCDFRSVCRIQETADR